jgi:hypothetical protein
MKIIKTESNIVLRTIIRIGNPSNKNIVHFNPRLSNNPEACTCAILGTNLRRESQQTSYLLVVPPHLHLRLVHLVLGLMYMYARTYGILVGV